MNYVVIDQSFWSVPS